MSAVGAEILLGRVMHRRLRPAANRFAYGVYFLRIPLARLASIEGPLLSINRWNLLSFDFRDHGARDGSHPLGWIRALLAREGLAAADGEVWLHAFPRLLGYVFNPVSFWFCEDGAGRTRAILAEVNNTFGERHAYLLAHADGRPIHAGEALETRKAFHVSPFCTVSGGYRFRFLMQRGRRIARIDYADDDGPLLLTSVSGRGAPLSTRAILRAVLRHPLMTFGVIARIHWQAFRLWAKRVPFHGKPAAPLEEVTR
ncbi:MAG: DUF1365 domain-containing protein [Burkholderiales bacterium]|nr:DUF1365 domain-containing protein [Burkholderiales bacterium]